MSRNERVEIVADAMVEVQRNTIDLGWLGRQAHVRRANAALDASDALLLGDAAVERAAQGMHDSICSHPNRHCNNWLDCRYAGADFYRMHARAALKSALDEP